MQILILSISDLETSENFGGNDYYIIKLDKNGKYLWEKTYGGKYNDELKTIKETKDGFLLIGNSNSPASGNKTTNQNDNKTWIVIIDKQGTIISENYLELNNENYLTSFQEEKESFLFAINEINGNDINSKLIKTNFNLTPINTVNYRRKTVIFRICSRQQIKL